MTDWLALLRDDPEEFTRQLRRGAKEGRRLAEARPGLPEVGEALLDLHDHFSAALWEPDAADSPLRKPLEPRPGTPGISWDASTSPVNEGNSLVLEVIDGYVTAVRDHTLGVGRLATASGPGRSLLALARVLLDASVHLRFLIDPDVTARERCSRALNLRLEALRQEIADARGSDQPTDLDELTTERNSLLAAAESAEFVRERVRSRQGSEARAGWFVEPHRRTEAVLRESLGDQHDAWRTLSSVVHAQERSAVRFPLGLSDVQPGPHATQMMLLHAARPIALAVEAMRAAEAFYGTLGSSIDDGGMADRTLQTLAAACGMLDSDIRQALGFE